MVSSDAEPSRFPSWMKASTFSDILCPSNISGAWNKKDAICEAMSELCDFCDS
jgi:hypothetical protein